LFAFITPPHTLLSPLSLHDALPISGKACFAAATASLISSRVECGRLAIVSPVAGFGIGSVFSDRESRNLPPMKLWTFLVAIMIWLLPGSAHWPAPHGMASGEGTGRHP